MMQQFKGMQINTTLNLNKVYFILFVICDSAIFNFLNILNSQYHNNKKKKFQFENWLLDNFFFYGVHDLCLVFQ